MSTLESIDRVTDLWLNPNYEKRKKAMKLLPITTGFSSEMIEALIKHYIEALRKENLPGDPDEHEME